MRGNEVESEGFFSRVIYRVHERFRICVSLGNKKLVGMRDDFGFFLVVIALLFFFGFMLPLPIVILGMQYGAIYGYSWSFLWIAIFSLLAYREIIRRDKTMLGTEWINNPKAIEEYVALVKKKD